jgi:hypothetical protein
VKVKHVCGGLHPIFTTVHGNQDRDDQDKAQASDNKIFNNIVFWIWHCVIGEMIGQKISRIYNHVIMPVFRMLSLVCMYIKQL